MYFYGTIYRLGKSVSGKAGSSRRAQPHSVNGRRPIFCTTLGSRSRALRGRAYEDHCSRVPLLAEKRDFTFSLKVEVLRSLKLIPAHILHAADLIRKVRNEFAHDFKVETFADCNKSHVQVLHQLAAETFGDKDPPRSPRDAFRDVTFLALAGFQSYRANFRKFRQKLDDRSLIEQWKKESVMEFVAIAEIHRAAANVTGK
jgi:hypothetical protein